MPVEVTADPLAVVAKLEATRLRLLKEANKVTKAQLLLEQTLDEYNSVYRLTPASHEPSC
jgi:hypothetical protein